jgi:hypothetical protein
MTEEVSSRKQGYKVWRNPAQPGEPVDYMGEFYPPSGHGYFMACDLKQLGFGPGEYTVLAPPDRPHPELFSKWWKVTIP